MSSSCPMHGAVRRALRIGGLLSLVLFLALSTGCAVYRDLRLTEIGKDKVELYLDEPADNRLTLVDHRLIVNTSDNLSNQLDLSVLGRSLAGGEFLIVWEDPNHSRHGDRQDRRLRPLRHTRAAPAHGRHIRRKRIAGRTPRQCSPAALVEPRAGPADRHGPGGGLGGTDFDVGGENELTPRYPGLVRGVRVDSRSG